jgi:hypothetical protein
MAEQDVVEKKEDVVEKPGESTAKAEAEEKSAENPEEQVSDGEPEIREEIEGTREVAKDAQGIAAAKVEAENLPEEEEKKYPSFFVETGKTHRINLDVLFDKKTGKMLSISRAGLGVDFSKFSHLGHTKEWVEFTQPTYDDIATYRQNASSFNEQAARILVDSVQMRNHLIIWHLKAWSLKDKNGNDVNLQHDDTGALSNESLKRVYELSPTFVDVMMTLFENEVLLR